MRRIVNSLLIIIFRTRREFSPLLNRFQIITRWPFWIFNEVKWWNWHNLGALHGRLDNKECKLCWSSFNQYWQLIKKQHLNFTFIKFLCSVRFFVIAKGFLLRQRKLMGDKNQNIKKWNASFKKIRGKTFLFFSLFFSLATYCYVEP